jgi:hypothetical protein
VELRRRRLTRSSADTLRFAPRAADARAVMRPIDKS